MGWDLSGVEVAGLRVAYRRSGQGPPLVLLYGDVGRRSPPEVVAGDLHTRIHGSRLVVLPGVGHQLDMEAPDRFNAEVRSFLRTAQR